MRKVSIGMTVVLFAAAAWVMAAQLTGARKRSVDTRGKAVLAFPRPPLGFEPNRGQSGPQVRFLAHALGYTAFLTRAGMELSTLRPSTDIGKWRRQPLAWQQGMLDMSFLDSPGARVMVPTGRLSERVSYLIADDRARWLRALRPFGQVREPNIWPGIDVVWHGTQQRLEYDFVVAPHANPARIGLRFGGTRLLSLDGRSDLVVRLADGTTLTQLAPVAYQRLDGVRLPVAVRYRLHGANGISLMVASYDHRLPLVIDPALVYSTYLGGSGSTYGFGLAVDSNGDAYVTGSTTASDFPTTPGTVQPSLQAKQDVFVTKFNAAGTGIVYSTFLGGSNGDNGNAVAVDAAGDAFVTGATSSTHFPLAGSPAQTTMRGTYNAFVSELNPSGDGLIYSTYLGGGGEDVGDSIAIDGTGHAYVTGDTSSSNFPTTPGAYQTSFGGAQDAFITKLNPTGSLAYSTYLGGSTYDGGNGIAVDSAGDAYVTGDTRSGNFPTTPGAYQGPSSSSNYHAFVTKLNPSGAALVYSTSLGGNGQDFGDWIAINSQGNAYVTGGTRSTNFPTTPGAYQTILGGYTNGFVTELNPTGTGLVYSTYLGGNQYDTGLGIAVGGAGQAYVTGYTTSTNFPTTAGAYQTSLAGTENAFVSELNPAGTGLMYSTYLGGNGSDYANGIAIDQSDDAYVAGNTTSTNFPATSGAYQTSFSGTHAAFLSKLALGTGCTMTGTGAFSSSGQNIHLENALSSNLAATQKLIFRSLTGAANYFRLGTLSQATCIDDSGYPPEEGGYFNTFSGTGTGSFGTDFYHTSPGYSVSFRISDGGDGSTPESTTADSASFTITNSSGTVVWRGSGTLYSGSEEDSG